jgi:hypothetical protein
MRLRNLEGNRGERLHRKRLRIPTGRSMALAAGIRRERPTLMIFKGGLPGKARSGRGEQVNRQRSENRKEFHLLLRGLYN